MVTSMIEGNSTIDPVLRQLLLAKLYSDQKRYTRKNRILQRLMQESPQDWLVDAPNSRFKGVTHLPTNFRLHADPRIIAPGVKVQAAIKDLAKQAAALAADLNTFKSQAQLMGSRGRAQHYGRPEPADRDYDYIAFTDDETKQQQLKTLLSGLANHGFKLKDRPGGFLTASGQNMDLSVYPTSKQNDIYRAWALIESGMSKDDAWAQVEKEKQAASPNEVILVGGHSGAGKSQTADSLAEKLKTTRESIDEHPEFKAFLASAYKSDINREHLKHNTPESKYFSELLQRLTREIVSKATPGAVIEGTQLTHLPREELLTYPNRVHVGGTSRQVLSQRLDRNKHKTLAKGQEWTREEAARKKQLGREVYDFHRDAVSQYRRLPQTLHYDWHKTPDISSLVAELAKQAALKPDVQLQEHQERIKRRLQEGDNRLLLYHGLGSGKSLSSLAAAEAAGGPYAAVAPASLKPNYEKEIEKFTEGSRPEVFSYTGLGMGKMPALDTETLIFDEAHRLRNPSTLGAMAAAKAAQKAKNVMLLTGTPVTNEPGDLASLLSLLHNKQITPEAFKQQFVGYKKVYPSWLSYITGRGVGEEAVLKNEPKLRELLKGKVDYQPSKTPEGVNVDEQIVRVPLSKDQQRIQKAIRSKIPLGWAWKLDKEFPLTREELSGLNSFLTGLRQSSLSTMPFRSDKNPLTAFEESGKLQKAMTDLKAELESDPRKKALIYSNFIDAGLQPYAAALEREKIPYGMFYGGMPVRARQQALQAYNEGKLRALLLGPAAAEGISTKGTSLIQLLDPHWHESRSSQARGRGLRFDSHTGLPENLKNVAVRRYISASQDPSLIMRRLGAKRQRTGDEILEALAARKEKLNEQFRDVLREEGSPMKQADDAEKSAAQTALQRVAAR